MKLARLILSGNGNPEVVGSPLGLVPRNALVLTGFAFPVVAKSGK